MAANMKSLVDEDTCKFFAKQNIFYIMHRFNVDAKQFCTKMQEENLFTSISIGIKDMDLDILKQLNEAKIQPDYITIDVAYAWSIATERVLKTIKDNFQSFVIVGNVGGIAGLDELTRWGANAFKIGIGGGKSCITKNKTGFYTPMASLIEVCKNATHLPIIADGAIREHGDIAKAIALGAHMVMIGSMFAGYEQSAGQIIEINGKLYKEYYGNASEFTKGAKKHVEGKKILEQFKGDMSPLLIELKEDLQSAISYAGGKDLSALKNVEIFTI